MNHNDNEQYVETLHLITNTHVAISLNALNNLVHITTWYNNLTAAAAQPIDDQTVHCPTWNISTAFGWAMNRIEFGCSNDP